MRKAKAPLEGIRVLDLGVVLAGPYASMMLGDLGAEVIRIESTQHFPQMTRGTMAHPTKESISSMPPISGGYPDRDPGEHPWNRYPWFNATARNKLGMTVDLKKSEGQAILKRLVAVSDVLITNQTPGILTSLGLGYEALAGVNPRLVYVEASSFGTSGPYSGFRAVGLQMEAFAGHDLLRNYPDRDVTSNTWAVTADGAGALVIALAAEMGLYGRLKTGQGQYIDVSMLENFVSLIGHTILDYTYNDHIQQSLGNRDYASVQGCYPCAGDDRWLVLTLPDDRAWNDFCRAAGRPTWCEDPWFATAVERYRHHDALDEKIAEWTLQLPREEAIARLWGEGVIAGPVLDDADAYADPHLQARGYFLTIAQEDSGVYSYPGMPYKFRDAELTVRHPPVRLGEHNEYVYKSVLGISDEEYARLEIEGHIGTTYAPHIR